MKNEALDTSPGCVDQDEFLFHQTKTHLPPAPSAAPETPESFAEQSKWLQSEFSALLTNEAFETEALAQVADATRFTAFWVEPGQADPEADSDDETTQLAPHGREDLLATARLLDGICRDKGGVWGWMKPGAFGCLLPHRDRQQTMNLAAYLQIELEKAHRKPVIIGVAAYPMINYHKADILENARKARDHAAFFGPGRNVFFDAVSLNISGDRYYQKRDMAMAVSEFQKALLLDPAEVNVHNSLGVCYGLLKRYDEALAEFETAIWLDAGEVMAYYNKGLIMLLQDRKKEALEVFLQADAVLRETSSDQFEVAFHIGKLYLESERAAESLPYLLRAVQLARESAAAQACLGQGYLSLKEYGAARAAFQKAIKKNPNDAASLSALAHIYLLQNENLEIALVYCRQSVSLAPQDGLLAFRLGEALKHHRQPEEALAAYRRALELGYDAPEAREAIIEMEALAGPNN